MQIIELFDPKLLNKYNTNGPRYTSYPTALEFQPKVSDEHLVSAAKNSGNQGLSLYIHIPFCHSLCYYCGCNKIVTRHQDKADTYLDYLEKEIGIRARHMAHYQVEQLHLGGGTPSFLTLAQQHRLMAMLAAAFRFSANMECSIEIDPRRVDTDYLDGLAKIGFNRLSIGVQDTDYRVQEAINREQSTAHIANLVSHAQTHGFDSVNLDLIYGLPHQTSDTFATTLAAVKAMSPERISLFSYAHLPSRFAAQRKIKDEWLPQAQEKFNLMKQAMQGLCAVGYQLIGMDHFAKSDDELAIAQAQGDLHRNFQGYTTKGDLDMLGLGVSSISAIDNTYAQNPKELQAYYAAIENQYPVVEKGVVLSQDDIIRRYVIQQLMCNLEVDINEVEGRFAIDFFDYFADDLTKLSPFMEDELVEIDQHRITVVPKARLLIRIICMSFDAYLSANSHHQRYSRVI